MNILSRSEEIVLLAVGKLGGDAYGVTIRNLIIEETGADWSIGAVYMPLNRLAKAGFLKTIIGDPTAERGGKRKKYYRLTPRGRKALAFARRIHDRMWKGFSPLEWKAQPDGDLP